MRIKHTENYVLIERFIEKYHSENGGSPSIRDISEGTGIPTTTVHRFVNEMRENGTLEYSGHRSIITKKAKELARKQVRVPLLGEVACGLPIFAEENIEDYFVLPENLIGRGEYYCLRAKGDSMIEAGILDGDMILVRQQPTAEPGQIVVALIGEEATLKRFYPEPENHRIRLHPENREMEDIYVDDCEIQGIAVRLTRELN